MAQIVFPPQLRDVTRGEDRAEVEAGSLRSVLRELEARFPGIGARLAPGDRLAPGIAVSIDGDVSTLGLHSRVEADSVVHIVAAIGGGV